MEKRINLKIEAHSISEIEPILVMRQPLRLKLSVELDRYQISKIILDCLDDFSIEELNEFLNRDGVNITIKEQ